MTNLTKRRPDIGSLPASMWQAAWKHPALTTFIIALLVRWAAALLIPHIFDGVLISPDSRGYHSMAVAAAQNATGAWDEFTSQLYGVTSTYLVPLTLLYRFITPEQTVGALYTGLLGALTAALTAFLVSQRLNGSWALGAGTAVALLPSQVLWSSVTLKDASVWVLAALIAVLVPWFMETADARKLAMLTTTIGVALLGLLYSRQHTSLIAAYSIVLVAFLGTRRLRVIRVGATAALALVLPWAVGLGPAGTTLISDKSLQSMRYLRAVDARSAVVDLPGADTQEANAARLREEANRLRAIGKEAEASALESEAQAIERNGPSESTGGPQDESQAVEQYNSLEPIGEAQGDLSADLAHLPRGVSVMLFEPYPWAPSTSPQFALAKIEWFLWSPLVLLALFGVAQTMASRAVLSFPLLHGLGTLLVYALTEGNLGTAFRHRGELVWIVAVFGAFGAQKLTARLKNNSSAKCTT